MYKEQLMNSLLQTILKDKNLHVLITDNYKTVFTKQVNVGFIEDGIFWVKKDWFTGGKGYNAIIEAEYQTLKSMYGFDKIIVFDETAYFNMKRLLMEKLVEDTKAEKDPAKFDALLWKVINMGLDLPESKQMFQVQFETTKQQILESIAEEEKNPASEKEIPPADQETKVGHDQKPAISPEQQKKNENALSLIANATKEMMNAKTKKKANEVFAGIKVEIDLFNFLPEEKKGMLQNATKLHQKKMKQLEKAQ